MANKVDMGSWYNRLLNQDLIELALAHQIRADVDPLLPFLNGRFARDVSVFHNGNYAVLKYNKPQAHYLMEGKAMSGYKPKYYNGKSLNYTQTQHPQAGADWINRAKPEHQKGWNDFVKDKILYGI